MSAENRFPLIDIRGGVRDPKQTANVEHDLVELLLVTVCAVRAGADTVVENEAWAKKRLVRLVEELDRLAEHAERVDLDFRGSRMVRLTARVG
ncbi:MAG: transposase family protein [Candidatus Accumulibacter meliphilus]|jgi:hypothetical protein|uniref:transposase family protein n=1 Tax=Candidatus Accumulibacter meliphilus TaxID=2211374 RepID=UPI002FC2A590